MRFCSVAMVLFSACEPRTRRNGAGSVSTLSDDARSHPGRVADGEPVGRVEHRQEGVRRVAVVGGVQLGDLGAAVAELGAGTTGLDDGHADPERRDLLRDRLGEPLDPPLAGVVERVSGERDLAAVGGDLNDPPAALGAQVRQGRADQLDGASQVGGDDVVDLGVSELLGGTEQAVAGIADDHVDAADLVERAVDDVADGGGVRDIQDRRLERLRIPVEQVLDLAGVADSAHDAVTALQNLLGELAAKATADAADEPGTGGHC